MGSQLLDQRYNRHSKHQEIIVVPSYLEIQLPIIASQLQTKINVFSERLEDDPNNRVCTIKFRLFEYNNFVD